MSAPDKSFSRGSEISAMTTTPTSEADGLTLAERLEQIRPIAEQATPGNWHWWTSCSWLRLGTDARGHDRNGVPYGQDGYVAYPYVSRSDGHPDLCIRNEADRDLIPAAVNFVRDLLAGRVSEAPNTSALAAARQENEALREALTRIEKDCLGCPVCGRRRSYFISTDPFHAPDCALAAALAQTEGGRDDG